MQIVKEYLQIKNVLLTLSEHGVFADIHDEQYRLPVKNMNVFLNKNYFFAIKSNPREI